MSWVEILTSLSPEIILCAGGLVVLGLDMVVTKKRILACVALAALGLALVATLALWNRQGSLLGDMYSLDAFALFFKVVAILTTGLVILSAVEYMEEEIGYRGELFALLLFATLAAALMAGSADLITIYLSLEFLSITCYILVGYARGSAKSSEAAIKYFLFGAACSAMMLYGMSLLYGATGTTNLAQIYSSLSTGGSYALYRWLILPAIVLLLAGFAFKIAAVPFHQWAPDTYEGAPTPITAYLSVGSKAAGFAVLVRVLLTALGDFRADWMAVLAGISMVSMTFGNLVAISQQNIKRMLAYSGIAQAGYILIGLVSISKPGLAVNGINGITLYLFAYLFANLGAFMAVIATYHLTGSEEIEGYAGLMRRAPWVAISLVVFFMSLAGVPPTAGFIGKLYLFSAAIQVQFYILAIVGVANSVLSIYYYFNVVRNMFFRPLASQEGSSRVPPAVYAALLISLGLTLAIGLYPQPFITLASRSVQMLGLPF